MGDHGERLGGLGGKEVEEGGFMIREGVVAPDQVVKRRADLRRESFLMVQVDQGMAPHSSSAGQGHSRQYEKLII